MATYIIGDVQGCYDAFIQLLEKVNYKAQSDSLVFCGDLVNRGGQSLEVLRWVYAHQDNCRTVLGNHDLSLLAHYYIPKLRKKSNTEFTEIFKATDCKLLMNWLVNQPLILHLKKQDVVVVHAGIYPKWSLKRAKKEAKYVEEKWLKIKPLSFFQKMYGTRPNHWDKNNSGIDRARFATNVLTRMRFLFKNGGLNFKAKGEIERFPNLVAWFNFNPRKAIKPRIIIGHWSALGLMYENNVICLDTGKVWGGKLTALKLSKNDNHKQQIYQI